MWLLAGIDLTGIWHKTGIDRAFRLILSEDCRAQRIRYDGAGDTGRHQEAERIFHGSLHRLFL
jgi:hypothetical protein